MEETWQRGGGDLVRRSMEKSMIEQLHESQHKMTLHEV